MSGEEAEAVLTEDGIIKKVGLRQEFTEEEQDETIEQHDLQGKTLLPGFVDPHGHITMVGTLSEMANLREDESYADSHATLIKYIHDNDIAQGDDAVGFCYDQYSYKEERH